MKTCTKCTRITPKLGDGESPRFRPCADCTKRLKYHGILYAVKYLKYMGVAWTDGAHPLDIVRSKVGTGHRARHRNIIRGRVQQHLQAVAHVQESIEAAFEGVPADMEVVRWMFSSFLAAVESRDSGRVGIDYQVAKDRDTKNKERLGIDPKPMPKRIAKKVRRHAKPSAS